jgi:hypothetical protein
MRKREDPKVAMPAELVSLDRWPGTFRAWCEARLVWGRDHGWPVDPIELIREHARLKREGAADVC